MHDSQNSNYKTIDPPDILFWKIWRSYIEPRETGVNKRRVREEFPSLTIARYQGFERHYPLHITWRTPRTPLRASHYMV